MTVRFRRPVRQSPPEDPQQFLLYRMESESICAMGYARMPRAEIHALAKAVCRAFKVQQVKVRFEDIGPWSGDCGDGLIRLNPKRPGSQNLITVAHELGHHVHECLAPFNMHQAHGPQFLAAYMAVLDQARIIPVVAMRPLLDSYGLQYNDPGTKNSLKALLRAVHS